MKMLKNVCRMGQALQYCNLFNKSVGGNCCEVHFITDGPYKGSCEPRITCAFPMSLESGGCSAGCLLGVYGDLPTPGPVAGVPGTPVACCVGVESSCPSSDGESHTLGGVEVGDKLLGLESGVLEEQTVVSSRLGSGACVRVRHERGSFIATLTHEMLLSDGTWKQARLLKPGTDKLRGWDGEAISLLEVVSAGQCEIRVIEVLPSHTFVADGVVHHNIAKLVPESGFPPPDGI